MSMNAVKIFLIISIPLYLPLSQLFYEYDGCLLRRVWGRELAGFASHGSGLYLRDDSQYIVEAPGCTQTPPHCNSVVNLVLIVAWQLLKEQLKRFLQLQVAIDPMTSITLARCSKR